MFSKDQVLKYLSSVKRSSFFDMVKNLKINPRENKEFSKFLLSLKKNNDIHYSKRYDCYFIPTLVDEFESEYIVNSKGMQFCFFPFNNKRFRALIFNNELYALNGDIVKTRIYKDIDEGFFFGSLVEIIERKNKYIYAVIDEELNMQPIYFNQPIQFNFDKSLLKPNTYVRFNIDKISSEGLDLSLDKILNDVDQPYADIELLIDFSETEKQFPDEVIHESEKIPDEVQNETDYNRVDLTCQMIVTIDGEKTKDFDDAISVIKTDNGNFILGVHIADVAYYVLEDSKIDLEARERATSIYLIDRVIPMLPEKLSNGICSLNPNVKRFTLTLESEIDKNGKIISHKIYPSMIKSKYRLTYNQVANMENEQFIKDDNELYTMLKNSYELSEILGAKKANEGYIDFEIEEPIIELDKTSGKAVAIKIKNRLSSEVLIENFMVFANEVVSKTISDLDIPSIYRIHEAPDLEKIESLKSFLKSIGLNDIKITQSKEPKDFQTVVKKLKEKRFDNLTKMFLLRTMQKAKYSIQNIGHFGLASSYYSHFTSPIRRYPDLLLHRIIWEVLIKGNKQYSKENESVINSIAKHSTESEIKATDLERKVNDIKKAEYYESLIDHVKEATIVSIQRFGMFVEFDDQTNSLIHISTITGLSEYEISEDFCKIILKDKVYTIGQRINVKITGTNKLNGEIDSIIVN